MYQGNCRFGVGVTRYKLLIINTKAESAVPIPDEFRIYSPARFQSTSDFLNPRTSLNSRTDASS
jgi:hypothetical protein